MPEKTGFSAKLRKLRDRAGMTQLQLAEVSGLHPQAIVKLEAGHRSPSWETVLSLARALGVDCTAFQDCEDMAGEGAEPADTPAPSAKRPARKGK